MMLSRRLRSSTYRTAATITHRTRHLSRALVMGMSPLTVVRRSCAGTTTAIPTATPYNSTPKSTAARSTPTAAGLAAPAGDLAIWMASITVTNGTSRPGITMAPRVVGVRPGTSPSRRPTSPPLSPSTPPTVARPVRSAAVTAPGPLPAQPPTRKASSTASSSAVTTATMPAAAPTRPMATPGR